MNEQLLVKAIKKLRPEAEFSFTDEDYSTVVWDLLEGEAPTIAQIDQAIIEIKTQEIAETSAKETQKAAVLGRLGITEAEAKLLSS